MSVKDDTEILMQDPLFLTNNIPCCANDKKYGINYRIKLSFTISRVLNFSWGKY